MNGRLTLLAVAVAVMSLIAAVLIVPRGSEGAVRHAARKLIAPGTLDVDAVDAIDLARADGEKLRFERDGDAWRQTQPIVHPMDPYSIRQLIIQAVDAEVLGTMAPGDAGEVNAGTLGLDPPVATLTFESAGQPTTLKLGRRGLGGRAYAQLAGDDSILIIKSDLQERATAMDPREWRDRSLFHGVNIEASRIAFDAGATKLELKRQHAAWMMSQPTATRADDVKIEDYVAALAKAQVAGFILDSPEDLARFGLEPAVATLEIESAGTPVQRLRLGLPIGASTGDRFAMIEGRPVVVRINQATVNALFPAPETLIDPTASGTQAADVKIITIRSDAGELIFERDLEKWRAPSHGNIEVSAALVEELLRQLTELRAPRVSVEPYPAEKQVATVTLSGFSRKPLDTVRIVKDEATGQWGLENGDNVLRVFAASMKLRLSPADYGLSSTVP